MKYLLSKPALSSVELNVLNIYANYLGYLFHFNIERQSAIYETLDKEVAYIQKDEFGHIFLVWKHNEEIEFIDAKMNLCMDMMHINLIPDECTMENIILGCQKLLGIKPRKKQLVCQKA